MKVANIREAGRATQGVKLINLDGGDEIAALASIDEQEELEDLSEEGIAATTEDGAADSDAIAPETTNDNTPVE